MPKSENQPDMSSAEITSPLKIDFPDTVVTSKIGHEFLWSIYQRSCQHQDCKIELDFTNLTFFEGNLSALLLAICHKLKQERHIDFECIVDSKNDVVNLLSRNGLLGLLNTESEPSPDHQQSTVQARLFDTQDLDAFYSYIETSLLDHHSFKNVPQGLKQWLLEFFFTETFTNIRIHAEATLPFATCGQYFPQRKKMHFSICDMGQGFFRKIRDYTAASDPPVESPVEAINWALSGGSTYRERGGSALNTIFHLCKEQGHGLSIVTDNIIWEWKNGNSNARKLNCPVSGSSIHIVFNNL